MGKDKRRGKDDTAVGCFSRVTWFFSNATGSTFSVFVRDIYNDKEWKVRGLQRTDTVESLKLAIQAQCAVPKERQRLYFDGKVLSDLAVLGSKNIQRHSDLRLLRLPRDTVPEDSALFVNACDAARGVDLDFLFQHFWEEGRLGISQAKAIVREATSHLKAEPNMLEVEEPITIVSDIHGQYYDLKSIFNKGGSWLNTQYLFLGDYVDRGAFSCEVTLFLLACKATHPGKFHLLRGNHESISTTKRMGFLEECQEKYDNELYKLFMECFMALPIAASVAVADKKIFCTHGGISKDANSIDDILAANRFVEPTSIPVVRDLLWADPVDSMVVRKPERAIFDLAQLRPGRAKHKGEKLRPGMFEPSSRGGVVKKYGHEATCTFLENNGFVTLIRGHQQKPGFEMYRNGAEYDFPVCFTIFSAPNYTDTSKNTGSIVLVKSGTLEIVEYGWRLHPMYDPEFCKDIEREDFHQFVHQIDDHALILLTEQQLDHAFLGVFPRRRKGKRDLWGILKANLSRVPELAGKVSREDSIRRAKAMIAWFSLVDNLQKSLKDEESYELLYADDPSDVENLEKVQPVRIDKAASFKDLKARVKQADWGEDYSDYDDDYSYGSYS